MGAGHFYPAPDRRPVRLVIGKPIETHGHSLRESEALSELARAAVAGMILEAAS